MTKPILDYFQLPKDIELTQKEIDYIWSLRPDHQHEINICGKNVKLPRLVQAQGFPYTFSGATVDCLPIDPVFYKLLHYLNITLDSQFNMLLINWYRNGNDYIGPHSDEEKDLVPGSPIATVSLGVPRDFILKNKLTKESITYSLHNNTVLVMGGDCQKTHKHSVPIRKTIKDFRISITFRQFKL